MLLYYNNDYDDTVIIYNNDIPIPQLQNFAATVAEAKALMLIIKVSNQNVNNDNNDQRNCFNNQNGNGKNFLAN